jgi:hypothetical protein
MECCLGKIFYATAPRKMPCVPDTKIFSMNQMLELAKGFEPPTL